MSASAISTHQKILREGLALMSASGLSGVTLGVLAERVGLSKGGLSAHFQSKEALQIALLNHTAQVGEEQVKKPSMKAAPGLPRLKALVRNWFGWAQRAGLPGGCPVAAGLFEFDDAEGAVRDKISEMEKEWRGYLKQLVGEAVDEKHLRQNLDVDQFVWELCGIYLSHHAAQRFLRADDADIRAEKAFENLLEHALTQAGRRTVEQTGKHAAVKNKVRKT